MNRVGRGRPRWRRPRWWPDTTSARVRLGVAVGLLASLLVDYVRDLLISLIVTPWVDTVKNNPWLGAVVDSPWFLGALFLIVLVAILLPPSPPQVVPELPETLDLPPRVTGFVGRRDELRRVRAAARHETVVAVVGERGVGTSSLLSVAAHELRGAYPDGQVYLDVRGGHRHPLTPEQVLGRVCHRFKLPVVDGSEQAVLNDAAAWLRTWLVEHQVLLVLDNVDDPDLVAALLPESGRSLVLLAGSPALAPLAYCVPLGLLSDAEGVALLRRDDPPQLVGGDHASAERLVRLCGHQPLAIRLLHAQLKRGQRAPESLANAIEKALPDQPEHHSVTALSRLRAICDLAHNELTWQCRRMFQLLALVPGTEIDIRAAAVLSGFEQKAAGETLGELAKLEFIESVSGQRYRLRHLLDPNACSHLKANETPVAQRRAQSRLVTHLAVVAEQQADALMLVAGEGRRDQTATRGQANAWFGWEHDLLYGLVTDCLPDMSEPQSRRLQRGLFKIVTALCQWYATESQLLADWRRVAEAVRGSPLARRDRSVAAWAHNELAVVHRLNGEPGAASRELTAARELLPYRQRAARTQVMSNLGLVQIDQRHVQEAVGTLEAARRLRGDRRGRALTDVALSAAHLYGDNPHLARLHADECLRRLSGRDGTLSADVGELRIVAAALNNLGLALWRQGDHLGVKEHWDRSYEIYSELDDAAGKARVLLNRATMLLAQGSAELDDAIAGLTESLRLRGAGSPTVGAGLCHLHLGHAYARKGDFAQACAEWRRAWEIFDRLGLRPEADETRRLLGEHGCGALPPPGPPHSPKPPNERPGWLDRLLSWWERFRPQSRPGHW